MTHSSSLVTVPLPLRLCRERRTGYTRAERLVLRLVVRLEHHVPFGGEDAVDAVDRGERVRVGVGLV